MKKRIISLVLALTFVFASVISVNAASFVLDKTGTVKTPVSINYKDIRRLAKVATDERGKTARIINATRYNGSDSVWIVRMDFGAESDQCVADYVLTLYPYSRDPVTQTINSLPFTKVEEGTAIFGPCWYYFGLFDDVKHDSCGFAIAERFNRWPKWNDLSFSGVTHRGVAYTGFYPEASSENFLELHIN